MRTEIELREELEFIEKLRMRGLRANLNQEYLKTVAYVLNYVLGDLNGYKLYGD